MSQFVFFFQSHILTSCKNLKCKKFRRDQISSHFEFSRRIYLENFVRNFVTTKFFVVNVELSVLC